ncbi:hypothetical protein HMPREF1092_03341 [Clostridium thermobutyricum]|uniref:Uncharacterized protein n=1 Tax=Clostridium thermobutyricum TaxID=29372 RepID=N9W5Z8_9CLOT|nr:hypothetical protein [Clostridium thermobutyricum]ENY98430.1 hypothetical protein HMPREF1092_03341 [Clostridium thermobutyricum]
MERDTILKLIEELKKLTYSELLDLVNQTDNNDEKDLYIYYYNKKLSIEIRELIEEEKYK